MRGKHYTSRAYDRNRRLILDAHLPCALCGLPGADTVDHIVPVSLGGTHELGNLRPAHRKCNSSRGNGQRRMVDRMPLANVSGRW